MSASNYLENAILDHVFGADTFTPPEDVWIALYTANPGENGDAETNEVDGIGYARVELENNLTNWPAASNGSKANGTAIEFGTPGAGGWGEVTHFAVVDTASGSGNILVYGPLTVAKTINEDDDVSFDVGALVITAD